jgi:hypothetical protein
VYEPRHRRPLPFHRFLWRMLLHALAAQVLVLFSLLIGMWGYAHFEGMDWRDAFVNSAMLLGGMGPVGDLPNDQSKIFAGLYALYAGLIFIVAASVLVAPVAHRIFHRLHLDED